LILSEKSSEGEVLRKMVIKYSYGHLSRDTFSDADGHLRNEYHLLERLRGAEHIVQLVPMADCSIDLPGMAQGEDDPEGSSPRPQNQGAAASDGSQPPTAPEGRRCPTFALEFLPGLALSDSFTLGLTYFRGGRSCLLGNILLLQLRTRKPPLGVYERWEITNTRVWDRGTLEKFLERCVEKQKQWIPNRILWRIWLCSEVPFTLPVICVRLPSISTDRT
jgi:hypothetical protein